MMMLRCCVLEARGIEMFRTSSRKMCNQYYSVSFCRCIMVLVVLLFHMQIPVYYAADLLNSSRLWITVL